MIEIIDYRPIDKASLKAQVTIRLVKWGGFVIKKIKIFEKGDSRWFAFPSEEYEKDGKKKWYSLVEFDTPGMSEAFRNCFFKTLDEYLSKMTSEKIKEQDKLGVPF